MHIKKISCDPERRNKEIMQKSCNPLALLFVNCDNDNIKITKNIVLLMYYKMIRFTKKKKNIQYNI